MFLTPKQRAVTLRAALEAHYTVSLPGAERMIEATINAALGQAPFAASIGTVRLRICPVSGHPCGMPMLCEANDNGCVNRRAPCPHNVTTLAGMVTRCGLCGEVLP